MFGVWAWRAAQVATAGILGIKAAAAARVTMPAWVAGTGGTVGGTVAVRPDLAQRGIRTVQVASDKITGYLLKDPGKAPGFEALGFTAKNADKLTQVLLEMGNQVDVNAIRATTQYGTQWNVVKEIIGPNGLVGRLMTGWQVDKGSDVLRLVTAIAEPFK